MDASTKRQFYYHSDASPLGGHITHPFEEVISTAASSSLAQAGGHVSSRLDSYQLDPIVSVTSAYSHISGVVNKSTGNWTTLTTSVVENLNLLEVVTADRIVSRLAVEHPLVGYTPKVSFVGVQFDNLRVAGHPVHPTLNLNLLATDGRKGFPDRPYLEHEKFLQTVVGQSRRITEAQDAPEWLKARYGWVQSAEERKKRGYVLCSLVEDVQGVKDADAFGHVITVPDFGNIFLSELVLDQGSFRLTMMRTELGCPAEGNLSFATADSNGVTVP
ncbi:MAG: hypothetical protein JWM43_2442 [Acidobacteriaceae bacterium]|nr:hypothetical protein [Acidobacteriaceae bacterium]